MDHEEAHKLLGLYVGATNEQIRAKFESITAQLAADDPQREQLTLAYQIALSSDNGTTAAAIMANSTATSAAPAKGKRGSLVVLFMAVTMVLIASTSFGGIWYFDKQQELKKAEREQQAANDAKQAWDAYRAARSLPQSVDGQRADEAMALASRTLNEGYTEQALEDFKTVQELYATTLKAENGRLLSAWEIEVSRAWELRLKDRFPFSPNSDKDASLEDVAAVFHPRTGALWRVAASFEALGSATVMDRQYATAPPALLQTVKLGEPIRDALFSDESGSVDVPFSIRLVGGTSIVGFQLETGGATIDSRGDNFVMARWTPKFSGAHLAAKKLGERPTRQPEADYSDSPWGLLRMLSHGTYSGETDGMHEWHFEVTGDGSRRRSLEGDVQIKLLGKQNPFDFETYTNFSTNPGAK